MDDIIKNWPYVAGGVVLGAVGASVGGCMQLLCICMCCAPRRSPVLGQVHMVGAVVKRQECSCHVCYTCDQLEPRARAWRALSAKGLGVFTDAKSGSAPAAAATGKIELKYWNGRGRVEAT